ASVSNPRAFSMNLGLEPGTASTDRRDLSSPTVVRSVRPCLYLAHHRTVRYTHREVGPVEVRDVPAGPDISERACDPPGGAGRARPGRAGRTRSGRGRTRRGGLRRWRSENVGNHAYEGESAGPSCTR